MKQIYQVPAEQAQEGTGFTVPWSPIAASFMMRATPGWTHRGDNPI